MKKKTKSLIVKKNSKFTKGTKKKAAGSSGVFSTIQARAQREGGRIRKMQKASFMRIGIENSLSQKIYIKKYILKSSSFGIVTLQQLKAMGTFLKRNIKKKNGKILRRIFPYVSMTKKPSEVRMGKGKGSKIYAEVYPIRPGKIIFELIKIRKRLALFCLNVIAKKLSIVSRIVNIKELFYMVYKNTLLHAIDNSGASFLKCIHVFKKGNNFIAKSGNIIIVSVLRLRKAIPKKLVAKSKICFAIVTADSQIVARNSGVTVKGFLNTAIILGKYNKKGFSRNNKPGDAPLANRFNSSVYHEVRQAGFSKVIALARGVVLQKKVVI